MKIIRFLILTLVLSAGITAAQQVYFVDSYTEDGEPIGAKNVWTVKPWGSFIYILLDTENNVLPGNVIYLFIDKKNGDAYEAFDSKAINIDQKPKWVVYNYKFTQVGEYDVYFITNEQKRFAGEKVTITYEESYSRPKVTTNSVYYDNCSIVFCKKILVGGEPLGEVSSISLSQLSTIYIQINNRRSLNTGKILVDIWRKKNRLFEYDEFVESKKYRINPDWNDAYFKYTFTTPGEYKFSIYNENEITIKTGYFTVTK